MMTGLANEAELCSLGREQTVRVIFVAVLLLLLLLLLLRTLGRAVIPLVSLQVDSYKLVVTKSAMDDLRCRSRSWDEDFGFW